MGDSTSEVQMCKLLGDEKSLDAISSATACYSKEEWMRMIRILEGLSGPNPGIPQESWSRIWNESGLEIAIPSYWRYLEDRFRRYKVTVGKVKTFLGTAEPYGCYASICCAIEDVAKSTLQGGDFPSSGPCRFSLPPAGCISTHYGAMSITFEKNLDHIPIGNNANKHYSTHTVLDDTAAPTPSPEAPKNAHTTKDPITLPFPIPGLPCTKQSWKDDGQRSKLGTCYGKATVLGPFDREPFCGSTHSYFNAGFNVSDSEEPKPMRIIVLGAGTDALPEHRPSYAHAGMGVDWKFPDVHISEYKDMTFRFILGQDFAGKLSRHMAEFYAHDPGWVTEFLGTSHKLAYHGLGLKPFVCQNATALFDDMCSGKIERCDLACNTVLWMLADVLVEKVLRMFSKETTIKWMILKKIESTLKEGGNRMNTLSTNNSNMSEEREGARNGAYISDEAYNDVGMVRGTVIPDIERSEYKEWAFGRIYSEEFEAKLVNHISQFYAAWSKWTEIIIDRIKHDRVLPNNDVKELRSINYIVRQVGWTRVIRGLKHVSVLKVRQLFYGYPTILWLILKRAEDLSCTPVSAPQKRAPFGTPTQAYHDAGMDYDSPLPVIEHVEYEELPFDVILEEEFKQKLARHIALYYGLTQHYVNDFISNRNHENVNVGFKTFEKYDLFSSNADFRKLSWGKALAEMGKCSIGQILKIFTSRTIQWLILKQVEAMIGEQNRQYERPVEEVVIPKQPENNVAVPKQPEDKVCTVCMDAPYEVVFVPCGHVCTCHACGVCLIECPLCRKGIGSVVKMFFA